MHLLTLIFGIVLLPKASTLKCYECTGTETCANKETQCSSGYQCGALGIASYAGGSKKSVINTKGCVRPEECLQGSINFGISRTVISSECCTSDFCNAQLATEPKKSIPNGKKCHYCTGGNTCTATLNCEADEDHCITTKVAAGGVQMLLKGCASRSICSSVNNPQIGSAVGGEMSCCQGDYCNSASSTSAGLLLLVTPLLSLVMFL